MIIMKPTHKKERMHYFVEQDRGPFLFGAAIGVMILIGLLIASNRATAHPGPAHPSHEGILIKTCEKPMAWDHVIERFEKDVAVSPTTKEFRVRFAVAALLLQNVKWPAVTSMAIETAVEGFFTMSYPTFDGVKVLFVGKKDDCAGFTVEINEKVFNSILALMGVVRGIGGTFFKIPSEEA